jgi:predicted porin
VSQSPVVSGLSAGSGATDSVARVIYGDTFSNYVAYATPNMSGFTASVALAPMQTGNVGNNAANKDTTSLTLQYGAGPLAAAVNITDMAQTGAAKITTILASYDLGVAKIGLTQQSIDMNAGVNPGDGTALTIAAPMGAGILSAGYGSRKASASTGFGDDVKQTHAGYRYNLSKRTHLNLIWNKIDRTGTAADVTETHLVVGHTF